MFVECKVRKMSYSS